MKNSYYAFTKVNTQGYPMYLTLKGTPSNPLYMFTGNVEDAQLFESHQEAFDFYNNLLDSLSIKLTLSECDIIELEVSNEEVSEDEMKLFKLTFINCYGETCTSVESAASKINATEDFTRYAEESTLLSVEEY